MCELTLQTVMAMFAYMTELDKVEIDESKSIEFEVEGTCKFCVLPLPLPLPSLSSQSQLRNHSCLLI